jgi:di/tricarboxylate transporter
MRALGSLAVTVPAARRQVHTMHPACPRRHRTASPACSGWPATSRLALLALFVTISVGVTTKAIPAPAVGLAGVVLAAMSGLVRQTPAQAITWALNGFSNNLAWLIFASMVLAVGYEKTGLGRRIALWLIKYLGRSTLGLGYVVALADLAIAPFTPSNLARSAGTTYPVIRNIPGLYGSEPGPTARRMGGYLMYTELAATCVTSSMFPTAFAANLLAVGRIAQTLDVSIAWREWVLGFLPVGLALLALVPDSASDVLRGQARASRFLVPVKYHDGPSTMTPCRRTGSPSPPRHDLDHLGAHVGERHAARKPRENPGEVDDADAGEWHRESSLPAW